MKIWPFALALTLLGGTRVLLASLDRPELIPARQAFSSFPLELPSGWRGTDVPIEQRVLDVLRLTDYLQRIYVPPPGATPVPPVWLYVGYYSSQRTGATYHSPKNCLPGAGWQIADSQDVPLSLPGIGTAAVNRVVIQKGLDSQVVVYWYQDRGRVIASEYAAKAYLIWDAGTRNRTDGAMVRVSTDAADGVEAASERALRFVREMWPFLLRHMPA